MSDEALRAAERRWQASGSADDEAAHLKERVRVGDLPLGRLQQAAVLGHPAAMIATGFTPRAGATFVELVDQAMMDDLEGMIRTCIALAEYRCDHRGPTHRFDTDSAEEQLELACRDLIFPSDNLDLDSATAALAVCCSVGEASYLQTFQFHRGNDEETFWDAMVWVAVQAQVDGTPIVPPILKGLVPWLLYGQDPVRALLARLGDNRRFLAQLREGDPTP